MRRFVATMLGGVLGGVIVVGGVLAWVLLSGSVAKDETSPAVPQVAATVATVPPVVEAPKIGEVRATSFVLVDATGKTRCEIGVEPDGSFLALNDAMGNARILLGVNGDKARVVVAGLNSRASAGIAVYEQSPVVVLKDGNGAVRANMGILPDSGPWVALQDGNGNQTWSTDGRR